MASKERRTGFVAFWCPILGRRFLVRAFWSAIFGPRFLHCLLLFVRSKQFSALRALRLPRARRARRAGVVRLCAVPRRGRAARHGGARVGGRARAGVCRDVAWRLVVLFVVPARDVAHAARRHAERPAADAGGLRAVAGAARGAWPSVSLFKE